MGVKLDFFCCVAAELQDSKFGQETNSRLYFYRAFESQTIDDMLEPGFFNEAQDLRVGDLILLYAPNQNRGYAFAMVISTMDGIVSTQSIGLKAQDVAVDTDELDSLTGENLQKIIESADAKITELNTNKADKTTDFHTPIASANKGATMAEITALDNDLQAQITSNDADILKNTQDITALKGAGGALTAYNFNTATPTQETLTKYAVDQIWPDNTNLAWNASNPAASTFTDANGVARTAAEIFNSTWVNNTYDDHRWQLTNTQNTTPKVFEWADVGRDIVAVATATTAGIVRVGSGSQMVVNPTTGDISLNGAKAAAIRSTIGAPGLSTENEYADNAIYSLQKGIILQGANGGKYTIRTDGSDPAGFIIYEGESSANTIFSYQPGDQNTITIGISPYRIKVGSSASLTSNDNTVATTEWVRNIIAEQMGGDFVQYWDSADATDHSHAKPGVATPTNHGWYRIYKSGWVEQGGYTSKSGGSGTIGLIIPLVHAPVCVNLISISPGTPWGGAQCNVEYNYSGSSGTEIAFNANDGRTHMLWDVAGQALES